MSTIRRAALAAFLGAGMAQAGHAQNLTEQYRDTADKLIAASLGDREGYDRLTYLCYRIGARLSGSAALEHAIQWSAEQMKAAGLSNVRVIPTKVPHWERGAESARMVAPLDKPLHMLGLGMSIGTPPGGITADIVAGERSWCTTKSIAATDRPACTAPRGLRGRPLSARWRRWCAPRRHSPCRFRIPAR
jgi:hypothetical protein